MLITRVLAVRDGDHHDGILYGRDCASAHGGNPKTSDK